MRLAFAALLLLASPLLAAEKPAAFVPAKADPLIGDWKADAGPVAQVFMTPEGSYQVNLLRAFDLDDKPLAVLKGTRVGDAITLSGDGWTGSVNASRLIATKGDERIELKHVTRASPTLAAAPPAGAIVLFDGSNLDAWAKKGGKSWLTEDGPAPWKIVDGGAIEVVPGSDSIISRKKFGDHRIHLEFRTLGTPTNSGVYLQTRYEVNVSETYGQLDGGGTGALANCTDKIHPRVRASLPPLAWQTLDIDFRAPRFDASGKKTDNARAGVSLNGVKIYEDQELNPPRGAAGRLGEAATGPIMLQEHGAPLQFRNIWVVESAP
jgi:hypothetical protein